MDARQRHELDRYITGNWGEDSVRDEDDQIVNYNYDINEILSIIRDKVDDNVYRSLVNYIETERLNLSIAEEQLCYLKDNCI